MTLVLASTYGWDSYAVFIVWPALNWLGATVAAVAAIKKFKSLWLLVPALVPLASGAWIAWSYIRRQDGTPELWPVLRLHILWVFAPALIALIAGVAVSARVRTRRSTSE